MFWINLEHQIDREEDYDLYNDVKMHKKPQLPQNQTNRVLNVPINAVSCTRKKTD